VEGVVDEFAEAGDVAVAQRSLEKIGRWNRFQSLEHAFSVICRLKASKLQCGKEERVAAMCCA
jgi:hypothetical protein